MPLVSMHAYLIEGVGSKEKEIQSLIKKLNLNPMEFAVSNIKDIGEINSFTKLTVNEKTAIVIKNFDEATTEAQSAFLKNLEEPPKNVTYVVTCTRQANLLPTIVSRCQLLIASDNTHAESEKLAVNFLAKSAGARLEIVDKIKDRSEALEFVNKILRSLHTLLVKTKVDHKQIAAAAALTHTILTRLKANGNTTLQLANLAINFPRLKARGFPLIRKKG